MITFENPLDEPNQPRCALLAAASGSISGSQPAKPQPSATSVEYRSNCIANPAVHPADFAACSIRSPRAPIPLSATRSKQTSEVENEIGKKIRQMFNALDTDGSGTLGVAEVRNFARLVGVKLSTVHAELMIDSANPESLGADARLGFDRFEKFALPPLLQAYNKHVAMQRSMDARSAAAHHGLPNGLPPGDYDPKALGCLPLENTFRILLIRLISSHHFENFILALIAASAVLMAMEDPLRAESDVLTDREQQVAVLETVFNTIFTMEMFMKILALGFVRGPDTYLHSPWNILDATVVLTAWIPYLVPSAASSSGIRAFRLLRPLRTINRLPGLKRLVTTVLLSTTQMQVLVIMVAIFVFTFACVGVQLWQGILMQRCHTATVSDACTGGEEVLCDTKAFDLMADDNSAFCDLTATGSGVLWEGKTCPPGDVCEIHHSNPHHGLLSFDNFVSSCIPVMLMASVSAWQETMHLVTDTRGHFGVLYFLIGTVFGGYFLFNLFVAVLKAKLQVVTAVATQGQHAFYNIDEDGSGAIDADELGKMFSAQGVHMTSSEVKAIFEQMDYDRNGTIELEEFTTWLMGEDIMAVQLRQRMGINPLQKSDDMMQVNEVSVNLALADGIKARLRKLEPSNDWTTLFSYYDLDGDNSISVTEFTIIVRRDLGMTQRMTSDEEIASVFKDIDTDGEGQIEAQEFAEWVAEENVESLWIQLQHAVEQLGQERLIETLNSFRSATIEVHSENAPYRSQEAANDGELDEHSADSENKASTPGPRKRNLLRLINTPQFRLTIVGMITANTAVLALDHHNIDPGLDGTLDVINRGFTSLFVLEMLLKASVLSKKQKADTAGWNLDVFMALGALADVGAYLGVDPNALPGLDLNDAFILARVIRPLRLVYMIPTLEPVYRVSVKTFVGLVNIAILTALFMFIFAILGMQLFGGQFSDFETKPRSHFDSFAASFSSTFQIMTFDSWQQIMYNGIRARGGFASLYFVAWVVIGNMVMLNLLLVIILEVYVQVKDSFTSNLLDGMTGILSSAVQSPRLSNKPSGTAFDSDHVSNDPSGTFDTDQVSDDLDETDRKSYGIFDSESQFRSLCVQVTTSKYLDRFILILIMANCVTMAMDHPDIQPSSKERLSLDLIDLVFTIIFTVEMSLHIISVGFVHSPDAYLQGGWNRIDFTIVVVSWLDYVASALDIGFLRTLRLLRALRALRMFNRLRGLKVLIDSLLDSMSALSTIFAVTIIYLLSYAILGVSLFKGRFHRCNNSVGVSGVDSCIGSFVHDGAVIPQAWSLPLNNFDNVGSGMFTLFTVSTSNDWIITAQMAVDAPPQVGQQPIPEYAPWRIIYFMVFIVIVNFFFMNLFIGVIYGKYQEHSQEGLEDLSKEQRQWLDVLRQLSHSEARKDVALIVEEQQAKKFGLSNALGLGVLEGAVGLADNAVGQTISHAPGSHSRVGQAASAVTGAAAGAALNTIGAAGALLDGTAGAVLHFAPDLGLAEKAYRIVSNKLFDHFIVGSIVANCIMMACTYHEEPESLTIFFAVMNLVFTVLFTVEMILKQLAFGLMIYFDDNWLRFDCFVVVGSWMDLLFTALDVEAFSTSVFRIVRISRVIGRVGRMFKLMSDNKSTLGLEEVMECLYQALPQLAYIGILVGLILFIFSILAMNLFGKLEHTGCIGPNSNFERTPRAVLTLLGVATKDRITCTIHSAMVQEPFCSEAEGTCGRPLMAQVFFVLFTLVVMFTMLEMFVNVVLQSFEQLSDAAGLPITLAHIEQFELCWQKYDPRATGWIAAEHLKGLFDALPRHVGMDEIAGEPDYDERSFRLIDLPDGQFSRYLLGETQRDVRQAATPAGVQDRIRRISDFVFEEELVEKNNGLKCGEIDSVVPGDEVDGRPSFVVQSNKHKKASRPQGKIYVFFASTAAERDGWIDTIRGTTGCAPYKVGKLHRAEGRRNKLVARELVARTGALQWAKADRALKSSDGEQDTNVELRLRTDKLYARLALISSLTRKEVTTMISSPYFGGKAGSMVNTADAEQAVAHVSPVPTAAGKQLTKAEFMRGLMEFNDARVAADDKLELAEGKPGGRVNQAMRTLVMGQLNFFEVLYAICERKAGKKLPADNYACREARIRMGVRMPSIKARVLDDVRRTHLRQLSPELLASMEHAGVADEIIQPEALTGLRFSAQ